MNVSLDTWFAHARTPLARVSTGLGVMLLASSAAAQDLTQHHLFTFRGEGPLDYFGRSLDSAGDVNGDGVPDVVVGAPQLYSTERGRVMVFSGRDGLVLTELAGDPAPFGLTDRFGFAVAGAGDLNGDGCAEFVVGAPHDDNTGEDAGSVFVFSGKGGALLYRFDGDLAGDEFGFALAAAGDVNADGVPDILVGAPGRGYARVLSGEWVRAIAASQAPKTSQVLFEFSGGPTFGTAVALVPGLNADGFADIAVGEPVFGAPGQVRVFSGFNGAQLGVLTGSEADDAFGSALRGASDVNSDGFTDLIVGAPLSDATGQDSGRATVFSGEWIARTALKRSPTSAQILHVFTGDGPGDLFGASVSGAGDVDADGRADLIVGATAGGQPGHLGYARLFSGVSGAVLYDVPGDVPGDFRGWTVSGAGDVNFDGSADVLIGAPGDATTGSGAGSVRLFSGARMALVSNLHAFSLAKGGAQTLSIDAGPAHAFEVYFVLGSATGTAPGLASDAGLIPLNPDWYYLFVLDFLNLPPFLGYFGFLDAAGRASAAFQLPPNSDPAIALLRLNHAAVTVSLAGSSPALTLASNSVPLSFFIEDCVAFPGGADCNGNGILDPCDIAEGTSQDCNGNGIPDECDIANGTSPDLDHDMIPDECTSVLYVDASATGADDGSSWSDAYVELAEALQVATPFTQVWVAKGEYLPDRGQFGPGDKGATFPLRFAIGIYGGFAGASSVLHPGGETSLTQRNWVQNKVVLSGDLNRNDVGGLSNVSRDDNVRNVVTSLGDSGTLSVLDGLTIRGGNANLTAPCDFYNIPLKECTGGGMWNVASPTIANCTFSGNYGGRRGGGMYNNGNPRIVDSVFIGNSAEEGGAIFSDSGSLSVFVGTRFLGNTAYSGGGLYSLGVPSVDRPQFANCLFSGNAATQEGGAMFNLDISPVLANCTFSQNLAGTFGGGLYSSPASEVSLANTILWGNLDASGTTEGAQISGGIASVTASIVMGWSGSLGGVLNSGADPLLANVLGSDGVPGTLDDNLRPLTGSPAVDGGFNLVVPPDALDLNHNGSTVEAVPFDLDGGARFQDDPATADTGSGVFPIVDIGAYERPGP